MKVHEYQAKEILARYGVPVPNGKVARTADEAAAIAEELGVPVVVKAQIHAGGRGKGGGIKLASGVARHPTGCGPGELRFSPGMTGRSCPACGATPATRPCRSADSLDRSC